VSLLTIFFISVSYCLRWCLLLDFVSLPTTPTVLRKLFSSIAYFSCFFRSATSFSSMLAGVGSLSCLTPDSFVFPIFLSSAAELMVALLWSGLP
jgi:hypothetical protein